MNSPPKALSKNPPHPNPSPRGVGLIHCKYVYYTLLFQEKGTRKMRLIPRRRK